MEVVNVSSLALPKGKRYVCTLCGAEATLMCAKCKTAYCANPHLELDYRSIHSLVCPHLAELSSSDKLLHSAKERAKHSRLTLQLQERVVRIATNEACTHLSTRNCERAMPAALLATRMAEQRWGQSDLKTIQPILFLVEATTGIGDFKAAEKYLLTARWILLARMEREAGPGGVGSVNVLADKAIYSEDTAALLRLYARLERQSGKLAARQGNLVRAETAFCEDAYLTALSEGPFSLGATIPFAQLGRVALRSGDRARALMYFDAFLGLWGDALRRIVARGEQLPMTESDATEPRVVFEDLCDIYREEHGETSRQLGELFVTKAYFHIACHENDEAFVALQTALETLRSCESESALPVLRETEDLLESLFHDAKPE
eukprot:gnl/Chilomastix_cuspidata/4486.p1 GENE.gnl/Chilomastix_cuspidata/4486~~gnl/Chilomastix_cuspidata/4486.p1  ORF type:complete len:377 (+),score=197.28 gnl/Chilomastix_cuspidata/4486:67-1197(+)